VPNSVIFLASGTYTLGNAALNIDVALSIEGTGSDAILSQANAVCVFNIGMTTNPVVRLSHLAIDGGSSGICVKSPAVADRTSLTIDDLIITASQGAGISITLGDVNVMRSTISNNGTGIFVSYPGHSDVAITDSEVSHHLARGIEYDGTGTIMIDRSLIANNSGGYGAGLRILGDVPSTIRNSTFAANSSSQGGGVAFSSVGLSVMTLNNVTFTGNSSGLGSAIALLNSARMHASNTLIDGDCSLDAASVVQAFYSLESPGDSCALADPSNKVSVSAASLKLGALADNGGATQTAMPMSGSVAIDAGGPACEPVDQRDLLRNVGACDIGAAEADAAVPDEIFSGVFD
jgi:hypothetical protein